VATTATSIAESWAAGWVSTSLPGQGSRLVEQSPQASHLSDRARYVLPNVRNEVVVGRSSARQFDVLTASRACNHLIFGADTQN
jgi:hypothetical protein